MKRIYSSGWIGYLSYHRNGFWIIDTYDCNGDMRSSYDSKRDYGEDLLSFVCRVLRYHTELELVE